MKLKLLTVIFSLLLLLGAAIGTAWQLPEPPPFEGDNNPAHDGQPRWCQNVDTKTHAHNCDCKPMVGDPECKNGEGGGRGVTEVPRVLSEDRMSLPAGMRTHGVIMTYYIQHKGFSGDCLLWWRPNGQGYTVNLDRAWKVTAEDAARICSDRPTEDIAWPVEDIDTVAERHLNSERMPARRADPLRIGDMVTAPSWGGFAAVITEIFDNCGYPTAKFDTGGFWRVSQLQRVETGARA